MQRSRDYAPASSRKLLAQLQLPKLPGRCAWDRIQDLIAIRQLPFRESAGEMLVQIGGGRLFPPPENHAGQGAPLPFFVWKGGHCGLPPPPRPPPRTFHFDPHRPL